MAKASETLSHPVFGKIEWLPDQDHWFGQPDLPDGNALDVIIDPGDQDRRAFLKPAADLFRWAVDNQRRVLREAIQAELLELYNESWRQEDEPALTADELAEELDWVYLSLSAGESDPVTFSYEAGELFGGHCVDVYLDVDLRLRGVGLIG